MKQHQTSIGKNQEWLTPPNILKSLGEFDLDPCSPIIGGYHGLANRVDRTKAIGNGWIPAVAQTAWEILK